MTNGSDFRKYHRLQTKLETDIKEARAAFHTVRLAKMQELQLRCFPSKEQVIEWIDAYYDSLISKEDSPFESSA